MRPEEYFSLPLYSFSLGEQLRRSAMHARHWMDHPTKPTPEMVKGTLIHTLALLGEGAYYEMASVAPQEADDKRRKEWKDWAKEQPDDVMLLKASEHLAIKGAADAARAVLERRGFLSDPDTLYEHVMVSDERKGMADVIEGSRLVDLKTVDQLPADAGAWMTRSGYHRQLAGYAHLSEEVDGRVITDASFLLVERKPPYAPQTVIVPIDVIEEGERENQRTLAVYRRCMESGVWPGPESVIAEIPRWYEEA